MGVATTRAIVYHTSEDLRLEEVPLPALKPGELLVRIRACGLCPGEAMGWYMARKAPLVPGHEPVAEVVRTGEGVADFAPKDRIFVHHHAPCLVCRFCRRGDYVHCATFRRTKLNPGGLSEFAVVPAEVVRADVLRIPDALSDEAATFVEPLACVVKAAHRAGIGPGDRVLVIGLGVMGMLHVLLARRLGAELVIGADRVSSRVSRATQLGADVGVDVTRDSLPDVVRARTDGAGADMVVVGPGTVEAIELGFACVAPGGTLSLFTPAPPGVAWPFPVHDVYFREITIVPSYSAGPPDTKEALQLLAPHHPASPSDATRDVSTSGGTGLAAGLPVEALVTHRYSLDGAAEGYRLVREATEALKVVVRP